MVILLDREISREEMIRNFVNLNNENDYKNFYYLDNQNQKIDPLNSYVCFLKIAGFNNPYIDLRNNNFLNLKEVDDLFNCDIFCISNFQTFHQLPFEEYKQLKIRIHIDIRRFFSVGSTLPGSCEDIINLGILIISTISGLITIFDFLKKKYFKNNPSNYIFRINMNPKIKVNLFIKKQTIYIDYMIFLVIWMTSIVLL